MSARGYLVLRCSQDISAKNSLIQRFSHKLSARSLIPRCSQYLSARSCFIQRFSVLTRAVYQQQPDPKMFPIALCQELSYSEILTRAVCQELPDPIRCSQLRSAKGYFIQRFSQELSARSYLIPGRSRELSANICLIQRFSQELAPMNFF
jgi:hypothetical protein